MKTFTFNTENELKSAVTSNMGTNPNFKFHSSQVISINGIEINTYLEVSNKHVSHYIGGGQMEFFVAPFNVILK